MSLISTIDFEDGVVGQNLASGGDIATVLGTIPYSTRAAHGSLGITVPAGGGASYARFTAPSADFALSTYVYGESTTSGAGIAVSLMNSAGQGMAGVRFHTSGVFDICNSTNTRQKATTARWSLGQWYRWDVFVTQGGGSVTVTARFYALTAGTETELETITASFPISNPVVWFLLATRLSTWSISFDSVRIYDSPTETITGFGAPVVTDPPVTPGTVLHTWVGAVTHDTIQVKTKTTGLTEAFLAVSLNADMSGQTVTPAAAAKDAAGYVKLEMGGLSAGSQYYYQIVDATGNIGSIGKARTLPTPGSPANFTVAIAACTLKGKQDGRAHNSIVAWDPDFMIHMGDFYYTDSTSTSPAFYENLYSDQVQNYPGHTALCRDVPMWACASDHEAGPDNGDSNNAWTVAHIEAFDQVVPHRVEDVRVPMRARYQSWVSGRVRFIMTDVRTPDRSPVTMDDSASKTMIGATQMAWLKEELLKPEPLKIIVTDPGWLGNYSLSNGGDKWWAYATERQEIIDFVQANSLQVEVWHGDSHSIAVKGKSNPWGGFPVLCAAPLAQTGGGRNLGEFDAYYNNDVGEARQYMRITFTDDGDTITRVASGWDAAANVERVGSVETYQTSVPAPVGVVSVGGQSKPVASISVIVQGQKKGFISASVIMGGVKTSPTN